MSEQDGLLAVPVTRLYDRGKTVFSSELLRSRIGDPTIQLNAEDADLLKVMEGTSVVVLLNEVEVPAIAHLDETLPRGIVLVPRSMGFPIREPGGIEIRIQVRV
jgi:hypothetical protein